MAKTFCAVGCPPSKNYFLFPSTENEGPRRKLWLNFFDIDEPYKKHVYACGRHFSQNQINGAGGLKRDAVPDIPVVLNSQNPPFRRKERSLRQNVIVVTPRDPEFMIYRNQTGVFHQNLFNTANPAFTQPTPLLTNPLLRVPVIKSVSCSKSVQTNTRLCGSVEVSEFLDEFRLNCFYCSKTFLLASWPEFVKHLKNKHFVQEAAFKMTKYLPDDHDYTTVESPPSLAGVAKSLNMQILTEPIAIMPPPPLIIDLTKDYTLLPTLARPPPPPPPPSKPPLTTKSTIATATAESDDKTLNLANKLIKLLDETVLNPQFRRTDEDNIVVIKKKVAETLQSNFLNKIAAEEDQPTTSALEGALNKKSHTPSLSNSVSTYTRPLYTLNFGQQNVVSVRNNSKFVLKKYIKKRRPTINASEDSVAPDIQAIDVGVQEEPSISTILENSSINKRSNLVAKRIAQRAIKNITTFENIYQTVKTRGPKLLSPGVFYVKDINSNKVTEMQTSNKTPLSRCLRRATGLEAIFQPMSIKTLQQKPTELVFEYSPKDVINCLLDNIQKFPALWEFHDTPYNQNYSSAITELCKTINTTWSLNMTQLKMRSSVNRILKFYRYMLPCENIEKFVEYFDKCALFLPSSVEEIPRARCLHCYICFKKDSELRQHLTEKHQFLKWPFKCDHCPERFLYIDDYELHKSLPHYVEIFKCQECDKRFNRRGLYNKHKSSHERAALRRLGKAVENTDNTETTTNNSTEKYVCNICHKEFKSVHNLRNHHIYHGEKKHKCHLCPKAYFHKSYLKFHIMRHKNQLDFICEVCGKGFLKSSQLNDHIRTHTGDKVTCNICNLKLSKSSLSRHRSLVHVALEGTIESTFRAKSHRYKRFIKQKTILSRTKETRPRQYDCKICQIPFERLKLLKDHNNQVHSNVKKTPCKMCNITYRHVSNLKGHYREKHKLHVYQIYRLVEHDEDLEKVLAIKHDELEAFALAAINVEKKRQTATSATAVNYFEEDKIPSDALQDEIMKAVEHIDNQEIRVDDEHSVHEFFSDLLKRP